MSFPYIDPNPEGQTERKEGLKENSVGIERLILRRKILKIQILLNFTLDSCTCLTIAWTHK